MSKKKKLNRRLVVPRNESIRISKSWSTQFYEDITLRINEDVFNDIADVEIEEPDHSVRVIVGLLIIKEAFDYSEYELFEKVKKDLSFQKALGQNGMEYRQAYISFCRRLYRYERTYGCNLLSECFLAMNGNRCIQVQTLNDIVKVDSAAIFTHIAQQIIYTLMVKALDKCVQNRKSSLGVVLMKQVEDLLLESTNVTVKLKAEEMKVRLQNLGQLCYEVSRKLNIKKGKNIQLRNLLDKYFVESKGKALLKGSIADTDDAYPEGSLYSREDGWLSHVIQKATERVQVKFNNPESNQSVSQARKKDNNTINVTTKETNKHQIEHKEVAPKISDEEIVKRLDKLDKTLANLSEMVESHFVAMRPIEQMLQRTETLYNNLIRLDNQILSQEKSLNSMVEKHIQILEYTQDLSTTSKDIYDLMKLVLMNSIVRQTKL